MRFVAVLFMVSILTTAGGLPVRTGDDTVSAAPCNPELRKCY